MGTTIAGQGWMSLPVPCPTGMPGYGAMGEPQHQGILLGAGNEQVGRNPTGARGSLQKGVPLRRLSLCFRKDPMCPEMCW